MWVCRTGIVQQPSDKYQSVEYDGEVFFLPVVLHSWTNYETSAFLSGAVPGFSIQTLAITNRLISPPSGKF